jgi:CheY-like chemotaxis protein
MPPRIVVLDDEDEVRAVWLEALQEAGYHAEGFALGADVLARLPDLAPDLIVLDMIMPVMDGYEFLARLRAEPTASRVPLLIVSAMGEGLSVAIDDRGADAMGVVAILNKPVRLPALLEHVERLVGPAAA